MLFSIPLTLKGKGLGVGGFRKACKSIKKCINPFYFNLFAYFCRVMDEKNIKIEQIAAQVKLLVGQLHAAGRYDLMLDAIGVPMLEQLRIEAARATLSPLIIDKEYNFILKKKNVTIELDPVHKAVYMLFLNHPEGIEFKCLADYRDELLQLYNETSNRMSIANREDTIDRLVNPLNNAINEKCSRIKAVFNSVMDVYSASYYIISSRNIKHINTSSRVWYERKKLITLPRELVINQTIKHE